MLTGNNSTLRREKRTRLVEKVSLKHTGTVLICIWFGKAVRNVTTGTTAVLHTQSLLTSLVRDFWQTPLVQATPLRHVQGPAHAWTSTQPHFIRPEVQATLSGAVYIYFTIIHISRLYSYSSIYGSSPVRLSRVSLQKNSVVRRPRGTLACSARCCGVWVIDH